MNTLQKPLPERPVLPEMPNPHFTASPAKRIKFAGGEVVTMNRATRRRARIFNKNLVRVD